MTQHERQIVAAEEVPALDIAGEAPAPTTEINPRWDVAQIATPGHVLTARVALVTRVLCGPMTLLGVIGIMAFLAQFVGGWAFWVVLAAGVSASGWYFLKRNELPEGPYAGKAAGVILGLPVILFALALLNVGTPTVGFGAPNHIRVPGFILSALTYDPSTYFDIGGGVKAGPELAWLSAYKPRPESLSVEDYSALVQATSKDLAANGVDAANWTTVGALKVQPKVTRMEKAFSQWGDRLKDGIVMVPENGAVTPIVAHVAGQWGLSFAAPGRCSTVLGPVATGCRDETNKDQPFDQNIRGFFARMKPAQE
jgi:hypothetical protein